MKKDFCYFDSSGKFLIKICAESKERAELLYKFRYSGTKLSYDEWLKKNETRN